MYETGPATGFWGLLTAPERALLASAGRTSVFPPGATMCVQGDPATHLFILTSGWVKVVSVSRGGQECVLALRGNGEVVGELAGEVTGYRTATIYAIGKVGCGGGAARPVLRLPGRAPARGPRLPKDDHPALERRGG